MLEYSSEHFKMREMIAEFDKVLAIKTNKVEYFELRMEMEKKMSFKEGQEFSDAQQAKIDLFKEEIEKVLKLVTFMQENMTTAVYDAVKKANGHITQMVEKQIYHRSILDKADGPRQPSEMQQTSASKMSEGKTSMRGSKTSLVSPRKLREKKSVSVARYDNEPKPLTNPQERNVIVALNQKADKADL